MWKGSLERAACCSEQELLGAGTDKRAATAKRHNST
jgi:hypothetical protein